MIGRVKAFPWSMPDTSTSVLSVTDLGLFDSSGEHRKYWIAYGSLLAKAGFSPVALVPADPGLYDHEILKNWSIIYWDKNSRYKLKPRIFHNISCHKQRSIENVDKLMILLSMAVRVEPGLLRMLRLLIPGAGPESEGEIWNHQDVISCLNGFFINPEKAQELRKKLKTLDNDLIKKARDLIIKYHKNLPECISDEEIRNYFQGFNQDYPSQYMKDFARTMEEAMANESYPYKTGLFTYQSRLEKRHIHEKWLNEAMATAWVIANKDSLKQNDKSKIPHGIDLNRFEWILKRRQNETNYSFFQVSEDLILDSPEKNYIEIMNFSSSRPEIQVNYNRNGKVVQEYIKSKEGFEPENAQEIEVITDSEVFKIKAFKKPEWAIRMGRGKNSIYVAYRKEDEIKTLYWVNAGRRCRTEFHSSDESFPIKQGFFCRNELYEIIIRQGFQKPDWADNTGIDQYGIWADVKLNAVTFRLRWIWPGEFLMGSPGDEPERFDDELQHKVILTKGYWIADTACTQALWETVMGYNPGRFKGANLPVETVSWKDCREFMLRINEQIPGLELRLPTEAEWEYACRAGTTTPFSFGESITTSQVNYDGNYPYNNGPRGEYRKKTVEVKALPCNDWGLYQMHGNVREWCQDWFGDYSKETAIDPQGPETGSLRVLRGGFWVSIAGDTRFAFRSRNKPDFRNYYSGFRLARGH